MKVKYSVEYHKPSNRWVVWQVIEKDRSISLKGVYRGNKEDCLNEQRRLQEKSDRKSNI